MVVGVVVLKLILNPGEIAADCGRRPPEIRFEAGRKGSCLGRFVGDVQLSVLIGQPGIVGGFRLPFSFDRRGPAELVLIVIQLKIPLRKPVDQGLVFRDMDVFHHADTGR